MNYEWTLKAFRRVAPMPEKDRVSFQSARTTTDHAKRLVAEGKYAQVQPLLEKALEIYRRLLTDDHPHTAVSYNNVAQNLNALGKYAQARPLFEKALEINRRLLTDDHPETAQATTTWRRISTARGSTPRPSRSSRRPWRSAAACSRTNIPTPPRATTPSLPT